MFIVQATGVMFASEVGAFQVFPYIVAPYLNLAFI